MNTIYNLKMFPEIKGKIANIINNKYSICWRRYLASCSHDGTVRVWDVFRGICVAAFKENGDEPVGSVIWY